MQTTLSHCADTTTTYGMETVKKKKLMNLKKLFLILTLITLTLTSCKTTKTVQVPVPVPVIKTEYINKIDSFYKLDSIFVNKYTKGDTVFVDKEKLKYIKIVKKDTIKVTDTITKPIYLNKTETKEVKYIPWYVKVFAYLGIFSLVALLIYLFIKFKWYNWRNFSV